VVDEDQDSRNPTPEVVGADDKRLALIPSEPVSRALLKDIPMVNELARDIVWVGWVTGAFLGKIVLLVLPCSPYLCSPTVLYPLLALACLDLFLFGPFPRKLTIVLHPHDARLHCALSISWCYGTLIPQTIFVPTIPLNISSPSTLKSSHSQSEQSHKNIVVLYFFLQLSCHTTCHTPPSQTSPQD